MDQGEVERQMKELILQSETIVCWDGAGELITGYSKKKGEWKQLKEINLDQDSDDNPFNGKKILEGHSSFTLLKVSSSPGHWAIVGGKRIWVPYP